MHKRRYIADARKLQTSNSLAIISHTTVPLQLIHTVHVPGSEAEVRAFIDFYE